MPHYIGDRKSRIQSYQSKQTETILRSAIIS